MATPRLPLLCAALVAIIATGCTDSALEHETARQEQLAAAFAPMFEETSTRYREGVTEIQESGRSALEAGSADAVLDVYRALRDATAAAADDFETFDPPASIRAQHESLIANLRDQQQALDAIVTAAVAQKDGALTEGLQDLATLLGDFATLHQAIDTELAQGP